MATAPVTEEQKPQSVSIDDNDNDVDDSDEEGAPEIAAADGQSHVISALPPLMTWRLTQVKRRRKRRRRNQRKRKKLSKETPRGLDSRKCIQMVNILSAKYRSIRTSR